MATGDVTLAQYEGDAVHAFASGTVEVDASEITKVYCGFQPTMIEIYYKDTGATTEDVHIRWFVGMTAGHYWNVLMSTGVMTLVTSGGPTVLSDTTGEGLQIPAALGITDDDGMYIIAWR